MLFRFSLYGFLKNQRYFEPFLVLAFLDKGLSYFEVGLLMTCREVTVTLLEIPSGAVADVWGRRGSMIASFVAYIASFLVFGSAEGIGMLFLAMILFGVGETFRTGTHKALIFAWLRREGRTDDRTEVYGYTRSWSKFGSALSALIAALLVFVSQDYSSIFYLSIVPYLLNIVNFLGYPRALDERSSSSSQDRRVLAHMKETLVNSLRRPGLRRLVFESMGFEGVFHAVKDYVQPALKALVVAGMGRMLLEDSGLSEVQRVAVLVAPFYFTLFVLSGMASRRAHRVVRRARGEERAARWMWRISLGIFAGMALAGYLDVFWLLIIGFVTLQVVQNLWRPVLISRFDRSGDEHQGATLLSIESQARRVATMILAPLVGLSLDWVRAGDRGGTFWPIGVLGVLVGLGFVFLARRVEEARPGAAARGD